MMQQKHNLVSVINALIIKSFLAKGDERTKKARYNISLSLLLKGGGIITSLALVSLTLDCLTSYEYGVWLTLSSILIWINYFDIGLGNGLRNKLTEAIARKDYELGSIYISTALWVLAIILSFIIMIWLVICPYIEWYIILNVNPHQIANIGNLVSIVFILFCMSFFFKTIGNIFFALQLPAMNDLLIFLGTFLSLILIFILKIFHYGNLTNIAIAFSLSPVLIYIFAFPITFNKFRQIKPRWSHIKMKYAKSLLGLGMQFFFLQICVLIIFSTSNILISHIFNPAEVTPYNIAFRYFNVILIFFGIIISPFWSAFTDAYVKKEYVWIRKSLRFMIGIWFLCLFLLLAMICISKGVYKIWIGNKVIIDYSLSISLAIYVAVYSWSQIFASFVNGIGRIQLQLYLAILQAIVFIPFAYYLSAKLGVVGIAYAMSSVLLISGVALPIQCYYLLKTKKK